MGASPLSGVPPSRRLSLLLAELVLADIATTTHVLFQRWRPGCSCLGGLAMTRVVVSNVIILHTNVTIRY